MSGKEELNAKILACGDSIRKAKADKVSKDDLSPLLAELSKLKAQYKETTGEDYVSPTQQKGKRKVENVAVGATPAAKSGPSKTELKKQAKAAAKAEKKGARPAGNNENNTKDMKTSTLPQLCLVSASEVDIISQVDAVKCLAAAVVSGSQAPSINTNLDIPLPSLVTGNSRIVLVIPSSDDQEGSLLFGANSIVRYYNSIKSKSENEWNTDEWLEWEETNLTAAVSRILTLVPTLPITSVDSNSASNEYLVDFDEYSQIYQYSIMAVEGRSQYHTNSVGAEGTSVSSLSQEATVAFTMLTKSLEYLEAGLESGKIGKDMGCVEYALCSTLRYAIHIKNILPIDSLLIGAKTRLLLKRALDNPLFSDAISTASQFGVANIEVAAAAPAVAIEQPVFCGGFVSYLNACFDIAIAIAYPHLEVKPSAVQRSRHFAHYQCNSSMAIFQMIKGSEGCKRPSDAADKIVAAIKSHVSSMFEVVESLSVAPQGFINIILSVDCLARGVTDLVNNGPKPMKPKRVRKVAVDFSSPNIAKEMHVGHLRSTIIGDVICRILTYVGHEVNRLNHVGDWGTQFGMLILHLTETFPDFMNNPPNITDLTSFYRAAKERFDKDEGFKKQAQLTVVKLQSGDATCMELWKLLCDISRIEFEKVYARLDVVVEERGESFYNNLIPTAVDKLIETGIVSDADDGGKSKCIFLKDIPFGCCGAGNASSLNVKRQLVNYPLFLRKSDGGYGYDSTDMTAIYHRLFMMDVDWVVYVTDKRQAEHFYMCFEAARRAKWLKDDTHRFEHVGFGMVCGEDGKVYKTRSGDTVRLVDLLDMSVVRMEQSLQERKAEGKCQMTDEEVKEAARKVGYGAVKYFDLKQHPESDYSFSYDKMLDTKGNTAVYLMFAYARFASILRKGKDLGVDAQVLATNGRTFKRKAPLEKEEIALAIELLQMPDVIEVVLGDMFPHRICDYLYELCSVGTTFVTQCFVLNKDDRDTMESRLVLCSATCAVMKKCFDLLGITPLERI